MRDFQRIPLNALKTFEAVARLGSLRRAAEELCVTHGAVGQQIKKLERHLAIRLLEKQGRGIALSPEGQQLQRQLQPLLHSLGTVVREINNDSEGGRLIVACSSDTAVLWLVPALADFCQQFPSIDLDIRQLASGDDLPVDVDLAIFNQLPEASPYNWTLLSDQYFFPVCSPALIQQYPHQLLQNAPLLHADRGGLWAAWHRESTTAYTNTHQHLYLPGGAAVISGALAGLGVALAHRLEVQQAIKSQQLIRLGHHQIKAAQAYFIATTTERIPYKASVFIQWLKQHCQSLN